MLNKRIGKFGKKIKIFSPKGKFSIDNIIPSGDNINISCQSAKTLPEVDVTTTDFKALPALAETLAADGWVIYKYEVLGSESVNLTIVRKESELGEGIDG